MPMVVLFDGANISLVGYRLMVPKADRSINHSDTEILFEHVTEESGAQRSITADATGCTRSRHKLNRAAPQARNRFSHALLHG